MGHNILMNMLKVGQLLGDVKIDYIIKNLSKLPIIFPESDMLKRISIPICTNDFSTDEISTILKGAIISEVYANHGNSIGYGSVTSTQNIISKLIKIDPVIAYNMLVWAKNFGFSNYRFETCFTTSEYYQGIVDNSQDPDQILDALYILKTRDDSSTFQSNYVLDPQRQNTIETRKVVEKNRERQSKQDMHSKQYRQFVDMLSNVPLQERLEILADDTVHTYNYYPAYEFKEVNTENILALSNTRKKNLSYIFDVKINYPDTWINFQKKLFILDIITYRQLKTIV